MKITKQLTAVAAAVTLGASQLASAETLRLLTWGGYAPETVISQFKAETGIEVEVTKSNNEDMISKLRATGGSGFDLAQPSQDRISGAQAEFDIYKAIDLSKIDSSLFIDSMLEATKNTTMFEGKSYGVPHIWGTSGLVLDTTKAASVKDYADLCNAEMTGKVSYRLKRPTLIGFAFSMGLDPFAAYNDVAKYETIIDQVSKKLIACKSNVKTYWSGGDALMNLLRSGEVTAAMAWDTGGWKLNKELPNVTFVAPKSGALGWIDTFALPRKTKAEEAAYKWINFVMQPKIASMITNAAGNFTASKGGDIDVDPELQKRFKASFSAADIDNIKWYPAVPAGLETLEGKALDKINAAK